MNNHEDWIFSAEALETKSLMLDTDFSVYVEGKDDILFWESLFEKEGITNFHIEEVGGYVFLGPYMNKIVNDNANIIVACDTHLSDFLGFDYQHERIIRTFGYSIENTMYNKIRINLIIRKYCLQAINIEDEIEEWISKFNENITQLLPYHIANIREQRTNPIIRDKCIEYLSSRSSQHLCNDKIKGKINQIKDHFDEEELNQITEEIDNVGKDIWHITKGHFLTNAVINYVKKKVKEISGKTITLSLESFYAHCVNMNEFNTIELLDVEYKLSSIRQAVITLKKENGI